MGSPKVVITLPAYRAERTLAKTVADIPEHVRGELILVDDASPDNTAELARSLGLTVHVHPANRGYGGNQKTCYTKALEHGADVVVLLHPDYQYEPKAVPLLIAPILAGDADMTFGSRFAGLGDPRAGGMPMYRYVGNRLTTILQNTILGTRFTEMHSGMRAYTRDCLLALPILRYPDDFTFDAELLVDAVTGGQRVVEVPIPTRYTKESSSIAMSPLVKYVTGGLRHSVDRALLRGRRGNRKPVSRAPEEPPGSRDHIDWVLTTAAEYVSAGRTLRILGEAPEGFRGAAEDRGWKLLESWGADVCVAFTGVGGPAELLAMQDAIQKLERAGLIIALGNRHADVTELVLNSGGQIVESFVPPKQRRAEPIAVVARGPRTSTLEESGPG